MGTLKKHCGDIHMTEVALAGDVIDQLNCFIKPLSCEDSTGYLRHVFRSSADRYKIEEALFCTQNNYYGLVVKGKRVCINPLFKSMEDISPKTKGRVRSRGFKFIECSIKRILCNGSKYSIKAEIKDTGGIVRVVSCNLLKDKEIYKIKKLNWSLD